MRPKNAQIYNTLGLYRPKIHEFAGKIITHSIPAPLVRFYVPLLELVRKKAHENPSGAPICGNPYPWEGWKLPPWLAQGGARYFSSLEVLQNVSI